MRGLTQEDLEKDKSGIEEKLKTLQQQSTQINTLMLRYSGALGYIEDNLKEEEKCSGNC